MNNISLPTLSSRAYTTFSRHQDCPTHKHMNCEFVFFVHGDIINNVDKQSVKASSGALFFINDKVTHSLISTGKDYEHRDLYIPSQRIKDICHNYFDDNFYEYLMAPNQIIQIHLPFEIFNSFQERLSKNQTLYELYPDKHQAIKNSNLNIAISLLGFIYEQCTQHLVSTQHWLTNFLERIQSPQVFTLPIHEIIQLSGYSASYFSHQFSKTFNTPFKQYITNLKVNYAKLLLKSPNVSISDLAIICGFSSQSHFTQVFKFTTGITPLQYRKTQI